MKSYSQRLNLVRTWGNITVENVGSQYAGSVLITVLSCLSLLITNLLEFVIIVTIRRISRRKRKKMILLSRIWTRKKLLNWLKRTRFWVRTILKAHLPIKCTTGQSIRIKEWIPNQTWGSLNFQRTRFLGNRLKAGLLARCICPLHPEMRWAKAQRI